MDGEASTVSEAIEQLRRDGYLADAYFDDGRVACGTCRTHHAPSAFVVRVVYRFEGASDPDDEAIVLGVECPSCATRAVITSAYGPQADPAIVDLLSDR